MSCLQYKKIIVDKNQSIPYFPPHCGNQCSTPSKVCPLRKRLPLSCHKNSSQISDATKLWKHTIPLTYKTKTLISNISETHRFSPQMRLIAYPDHKTALNVFYPSSHVQYDIASIDRCSFFADTLIRHNSSSTELSYYHQDKPYQTVIISFIRLI